MDLNKVKLENNFSLIFWLPFICFVLHTIEEIPDFAAWVSHHFRPYTTEHFVFSHIPLIWLALLTSYFAFHSKKVGWKVLATAWQIQFFMNAIFHFVTTLLFSEYSPGLFTAVAINVPATVFFLMKVYKDKILSKRQFILSFLIGTLAAGLAISSLLI